MILYIIKFIGHFKALFVLCFIKALLKSTTSCYTIVLQEVTTFLMGLLRDNQAGTQWLLNLQVLRLLWESLKE